jgi:hypothetical protein
MPDLLRLLLADEMELYEVVFHSNVNIDVIPIITSKPNPALRKSPVGIVSMSTKPHCGKYRIAQVTSVLTGTPMLTLVTGGSFGRL